MDLTAGLPPATQRSKRRMIVISPREEKWSLHEDLHLDLELRGLASCLLDDEGKLEPAAGVAPAWSDLQGRHVARYV